MRKSEAEGEEAREIHCLASFRVRAEKAPASLGLGVREGSCKFRVRAKKKEQLELGGGCGWGVLGLGGE